MSEMTARSWGWNQVQLLQVSCTYTVHIVLYVHRVHERDLLVDFYYICKNNIALGRSEGSFCMVVCTFSVYVQNERGACGRERIERSTVFRTPGARPLNYFRNVRHLISAPLHNTAYVVLQGTPSNSTLKQDHHNVTHISKYDKASKAQGAIDRQRTRILQAFIFVSDFIASPLEFKRG